MTITNIRHTGVVVSDMEKALKFYRDLLGMEVWWEGRDSSEIVRQITNVPEANIWMVKLKAKDGVSIELLQYLSHPQHVPEAKKSYDAGCNHIALQVDDIDALYVKLISAGIQFHTPPLVSSDGDAKVTYCRDPEGVILELVELLPSAAKKAVSNSAQMA